MDADLDRKKRKEANPRVDEKTKLAQRLIAARTIRGWLAEEVEERYGAIGALRGGQTGVVYTKIKEWEGGRARDGEPDLNEHQRTALSEALGVREDWFDAHPDQLLGGAVLDLPESLTPPDDIAETARSKRNGQATSEGGTR